MSHDQTAARRGGADASRSQRRRGRVRRAGRAIAMFASHPKGPVSVMDPRPTHHHPRAAQEVQLSDEGASCPTTRSIAPPKTTASTRHAPHAPWCADIPRLGLISGEPPATTVATSAVAPSVGNDRSHLHRLRRSRGATPPSTMRLRMIQITRPGRTTRSASDRPSRRWSSEEAIVLQLTLPSTTPFPTRTAHRIIPQTRIGQWSRTTRPLAPEQR